MPGLNCLILSRNETGFLNSDSQSNEIEKEFKFNSHNIPRLIINSRYLYYAFLLSAAIGCGISYSKVYLFHLLLVATAMYITYENRRILVFPILESKFHRFFFAFVSWYTLSLLWSSDPLDSVKYVLIVYMCSFLSLFIIYYGRLEGVVHKMFKLFSFIFILEIIFSLLEIFTDFRLPISPYSDILSYFGREFHLSEKYTPYQIEILKNSATGFEWNMNNLAALMIILFPFFFFYPGKLVKYFGTASCVIIILASGSRGVFLALGFAFGIYLIFFKKSFLRISMIAVMIFLFGVLITQVASDSKQFVRIKEISESHLAFQELFEEGGNEENSISMRKDLMKTGMDSFYKSYGMGIGAGSTHSVFREKGGIGVYHLTDLHNFWLELFIESGVVFTLAFLFWYVGLWAKLYYIGFSKELDPKLKYYAHSCSLALIGFSVAAISASSALYFLPMWILFGFSILVLNKSRQWLEENSKQELDYLPDVPDKKEH